MNATTIAIIIIPAALSKALFTLTNIGLNNLYSSVCYSHTGLVNHIKCFCKEKVVKASTVKGRIATTRESC